MKCIWIYFPIIVYGSVSLIAGILSLMFSKTLSQPLPQNVNDVEKINSKSKQEKIELNIIQRF